MPRRPKLRPRKLSLENFGPYRERVEIDFSRLGPVFLVWGKTGSGKTTLFDGLTYALYGEAPGSRSGLEKQLYSHFARPGDKPLVEFEFALGAEIYRATRSPPFRRLNRRGEETEVPAAAKLERRDGGGWTLLGEKIGEVDEAVRRLLGLSAEEFSKIILLPQGEFQRFLEMDSSERVTILEKLFPVELHEAVTGLARDRVKLAVEEARRLDRELGRVDGERGGAEAEAKRGAAALALAEAETARAEAVEALRRSDGELARAREARERRSNLAQAEARLRGLEAEAPIRAQAEARVRGARQAAPCLPLIDRFDRAASALREGRRELETRQAAVSAAEGRRAGVEADRRGAEAALSRLGIIDRELGELEKRRSAWKTAGAAATAREEAARATARAERAAMAAREGEGRALEALSGLRRSPEEAARITAEFQEAREALQRAGDLERMAGEAAAARRAAASARADAERWGQEAAGIAQRLAGLEAARERGLAAALAARLQAGAPCPVCGSTQHPAPASAEAGPLPTPAQLQELRAERDRCMSQAAAAAARAEKDALSVEALRTRAEPLLADEVVGAATEVFDFPEPAAAREAWLQAKERVSAAAEAYRKLEAARMAEEAARHGLEAAQAERSRAETTLNEAKIELARREEGLRLAREHAGGEDPEPRLQALAAEREALEAGRRSALGRVEAWERETERGLTLLRESQERLPIQEAELRTAREALDAALALAGYADPATAQAAALPSRELAELEAANAAYARDRAAAAAAAAEARRALGGEAGPEPDLPALEAAATAARSALDAAQLRSSAAREELSRLERLSAERERLLAERRALDESSGRLAEIAALLAGEISGRRLPFKNYVLGAYFRRVVELASLRLAELSDGRYGLQASEGSGGRGRIGLELLVRDAYTGRSRPAGTLSGGERFLSSLALALGLADAIRSRSGGIDLDAVFIDEGFGSLDEEALDRAIAALDRARGERTIGIVSHVAELRSRIPSRIEVAKGKSGSRLEILG